MIDGQGTSDNVQLFSGIFTTIVTYTRSQLADPERYTGTYNTHNTYTEMTFFQSLTTIFQSIFNTYSFQL